MSEKETWYELKNPEKVASPALLIYPDRVRGNIELMIKIAGDVNRLRPHVKTHKLPQLLALQVSYGIKKFKCATIAEAEMIAQNGGEDILLAYQPAGPHIERLFNLKEAYPELRFATLVDNSGTMELLSNAAELHRTTIDLYVDIDNGMHRTGIEPGDESINLIREILSSSNLNFSGLHVYDGHIREHDPILRAQICNRDFEGVLILIEKLKKQNIEIPHLITGGSPSFPIHARFKDRELSPGTVTLWDMGYSRAFSDLAFQHAAVLLNRVVSKPQKVNLCLDLGHKALSADKPNPRVIFKAIDNYKVLSQNEEHLVIHSPETEGLEVGTVVYGIPVHICPTTAMYDEVCVIKNQEFVDLWKVTARARKLTV